MQTEGAEKPLDQERRELWERVQKRWLDWLLTTPLASVAERVELQGEAWWSMLPFSLMTAPPEGLRFCSLRLIPANVDQPEGPRWHASFTAAMGCRSHPDAACAVILAALAAAGEPDAQG